MSGRSAWPITLMRSEKVAVLWATAVEVVDAKRLANRLVLLLLLLQLTPLVLASDADGGGMYCGNSVGSAGSAVELQAR